MFKKEENKEIIKWLSVIHNDLTEMRSENREKLKPKKDKQVYEQLKGFRDALLLDACSGVGYIHEGKFYSDLIELENGIEGTEDLDKLEAEIPVDRVISVDYLIHFLNQILEK